MVILIASISDSSVSILTISKLSSISLGRTRRANCSSMFIMQRYKIL
nr:MAG TPA: hypothetical protein [Caudoviricetes sp.]